MEELILNGEKKIAIDGVSYYYGEVTINSGEYIIVPGIYDNIILYDGTYDPSEFKNIDYTNFVLSNEVLDNPEWKKVITDFEEKVLYGIRQDDSVYNPDLSSYNISDGDGHTEKVSTVIDSLTKWLLYNKKVYRANKDNFTLALGAKVDDVNPSGATPFSYSLMYTVSTETKKVVLEKKTGETVVPFTSAEGVMLVYGEDVQTQLNALDIDKIHNEETTVIANLSVTSDAGVNDVRYTAETKDNRHFRTDLDSLDERVKDLDKQVFPLKLSYSRSFNSSALTCTYNYTTTEYEGIEPTLTSSYVEKYVNGAYSGKIYDPEIPQANGSFTSQISGSKEEYVFTMKKDVKEVQSTSTNYLCFYGASKNTDITSDKALTLNRTISSSVSFNPTINTSYGDYIWLIVPTYLRISKVTSSGFDVSLNAPVQFNIGSYGTYYAYRTLNALDSATWKLVIS